MSTDADASALPKEVRAIRIAAARSGVLCAACLMAGYFLLPQFITFPTNTLDAVIFTIRVDLFVLVWIMVGIGLVSHARRQSMADIRGSGFGAPTPQIRIKIAFLQNTLEQAIVAIGSHIVLSTLVSGASLSFVVVATILFGIGRITFYRGYPSGAAGRAFGVVTTALPGLMAWLLSAILIGLRLFGWAP